MAKTCTTLCRACNLAMEMEYTGVWEIACLVSERCLFLASKRLGISHVVDERGHRSACQVSILCEAIVVVTL